MRQTGVETLMKAYVNCSRNHKGHIRCSDQDILNLVYEKDQASVVDQRFNGIIPDTRTFRKGEYRWIKDNSRILHFTDKRKPWNSANYSNRAFLLYSPYYMGRVRRLARLILFRFAAIGRTIILDTASEVL